MDLITVIIPVYKVEPYLDRCVQSVIDQTYGNIEIILVDDGSPDGCPAICDAWAKKDDRVRVIHQKNGGLSAARNAGLDCMRGEYVSFVDSDDAVEREHIARLYDAIVRANADIAVCNFEKVTDPGDTIERNGDIKAETLSGHACLGRIAMYAPGNISFVIACNKLFRRNLFTGLRFENGRYHEDEWFCHKAYDLSAAVACIPDATYKYFIRSDSIMGTPNEQKSVDFYAAIFDRCELFLQRGLTDCFIRSEKQCCKEAIRLLSTTKQPAIRTQLTELLKKHLPLYCETAGVSEFDSAVSDGFLQILPKNTIPGIAYRVKKKLFAAKDTK